MIHPHHTFDLIIELLRKELKVRYKRLALGYIWSILSPLMYAGLYFLVFGHLLNVKTENYPLFLISGLFPWQWLANSINIAPSTFVSNKALIKKTLFPRHLISLVVVMQDGLHFLVSIPVIILFVSLFQGQFSAYWLIGIPLLFSIQFLMAFSLNLIFSTLTVFFRDLERFLQIGMTFLFYMTPVLYSEEKIPAQYQDLILFHPIAPLLISWRNLFMRGQVDWVYLGSATVWAIVLYLMGRWIFKRLSWRFAEVM